MNFYEVEGEFMDMPKGSERYTFKLVIAGSYDEAVAKVMAKFPTLTIRQISPRGEVIT